MVATFVAGFWETTTIGLNGAIFQATVPPEMQGRVFSLSVSASQLMAPLGLAIAGPLADALDAQSWWLLAGVATSAMGVGTFFVPTIMRIEDKVELGHKAADTAQPGESEALSAGTQQ